MKTTLALCLALLALTPASAEVFRPDFSRGGRGRHVEAPRYHGGDRHRVPVHVSRHHHGYHHYGYTPYRGFGYGRHWDHGPRVGFSTYWGPSYGYYSGYGYGYPYYDTAGYYGGSSAAASGLLWGALAGGIIGHNSGEFRHNGWRGAAWGAGLGWLLGSVVDANRRPVAYSTAPMVVQQPPVVPQAPQPAAAQPQQVTIINHYYNSGSPMSAANGLFGR